MQRSWISARRRASCRSFWLKAHPHLRGIGFDLSMVRPVFEEFVAGHGLSDRVAFKAGDFFADDLPKTDVIVMGHILHDWDLAQKKALLAKAFAALPKGGAVIAYDPILDDDRRENTFGLLGEPEHADRDQGRV